MHLPQLPASTILLYCILAAAILIYLPFLAVSYARMKVGLDLAAPRAMFDKLPPYAQRATWAHQNSFEAFMIFAAAALMAYVTEQNSNIAVGSAITFIIARLFYSIFYILNVPLARSLMFAISGVCSITLMILSILQVTASTLP
ncbi:MAG: MAPEG family protein [Chroococcidiopsidaceae cyanobacterium CP_BM_ER_R8_30]|nr:MAPEG family protein [Chroococcidiopsidaceae cyanobacterium CP_BM_ER_R8_30]